MMMHMLPWSALPTYVIAELLGGAAAALAFRALNPADK